MEEEKKRRPRILKQDGAAPLNQREGHNEDPAIQQDRNWNDRDDSQDRNYARPDNYNNRQDDTQGGGWQDRNQGGGGWQNRNQGGGGWQDRNQGGGGGWQNRNQGGGGGWQDRNQGGGGGWQNRNQGGGGGWQDRSQGGGRMQKNFGGGNRKKQFRKQEEFQVQIMPKPDLPSGEDMPLNKYLAHCGIASRRKAVEYITTGQVTVNGTVKMEPFYRVHSDDVIMCAGKLLQVQERMVYVLLNKPKGVITTTDDEKGRATVLDIVDPHYPERLFPVGRLDRDTTGLILLTNDGDLAQKLTHPSYNIQKQYRVGLRKPLAQADLELIESGVTLDDGPVEVNWVRFSEDHPKHNVVELEITSGRNRIIRRLFEALDYEIFKLDRFYFAGLTKKDLPRGQFRDLTQREVMMLKHFTGHPGTAKRRRKNDENADAEDSAEQEDNAIEMESAEAND